MGKVNVTDGMLSDVLKAQVEAIFLTPSVASKPVVRTTGKKGIGLSITDAFGRILPTLCRSRRAMHPIKSDFTFSTRMAS